MPTLDIYAQTSFKDKIGISQFLQAHQSRHSSYCQAAQRKGLSFADSDFTEYPDDDWFDRHYAIHIQLTTLVQPTPTLNIQTLADYTWDDEDDFYTWMQAHCLIHQQIDQYFGNLS
jgi:hypothetical protein